MSTTTTQTPVTSQAVSNPFFSYNNYEITTGLTSAETPEGFLGTMQKVANYIAAAFTGLYEALQNLAAFIGNGVVNAGRSISQLFSSSDVEQASISSQSESVVSSGEETVKVEEVPAVKQEPVAATPEQTAAAPAVSTPEQTAAPVAPASVVSTETSTKAEPEKSRTQRLKDYANDFQKNHPTVVKVGYATVLGLGAGVTAYYGFPAAASAYVALRDYANTLKISLIKQAFPPIM